MSTGAYKCRVTGKLEEGTAPSTVSVDAAGGKRFQVLVFTQRPDKNYENGPISPDGAAQIEAAIQAKFGKPAVVKAEPEVAK